MANDEFDRGCREQDGPYLLRLYRRRDHVSHVKRSITVRPGLTICDYSDIPRNF